LKRRGSKKASPPYSMLPFCFRNILNKPQIFTTVFYKLPEDFLFFLDSSPPFTVTSYGVTTYDLRPHIWSCPHFIIIISSTDLERRLLDSVSVSNNDEHAPRFPPALLSLPTRKYLAIIICILT
jgi:hypothetical protein